MTFFLTSVFIFLVMWRPQDWLVPWIYGWPILDLVVVLSLFTFVIENDAGRVRIPKRVPQLGLLLGLWFAAIMSHAANFYFAGMLEAIPAAFKICFFTALLICLIDRIERIRTISVLLVVMSCLMAWHCFLQIERGYGFGGLRPMFDPKLKHTGDPFRTYFFGIFGDPNDTAQVLIASIPLVFVIPKRMNFISFSVCSAVALFLLSQSFLTQSRGGLIALGALAAVFCVLMLPDRLIPYGLAILVLGGLAACTLAGPLLDMSARERVVFWGMGNEVFKTKPLFGIGQGMFWQVAGSRAAHNAFVACYVEMGFFGYVCWFGLLYLGFVGNWRTRMHLGGRKGSRERWLKRTCGMLMASASAFAASSYFLSRTFLYPQFFIFALLAAVPVAAREFVPEAEDYRVFSQKDVRLIMPLLAVSSVIYIYLSILFLNRAYGG